ncbi:transcriptional regulator with XRE-family HTH domain [Azospirillum agricola]|uniref:helix-turn-helix domain-containing protein n=1 Tax=Azospirillum agricola TaxID=1720247 RepID=UPI001AE12FCE|nr:helix-turn-helix transcriptional regulator [Azospirillum agricola]MBP2233123.1 transcriptional regulator with XRE-family HTH domain [Azospirillum agricola]
MASRYRWGDVQHGSSALDAGVLGGAARLTARSDRQPVHMEPLQDGAPGEAALGAEDIEVGASQITAVQLQELHHAVSGRDKVCLRHPQPLQPEHKQINSFEEAIKQPGIISAPSANTPHRDKAIIPAMPIRSKFPERPYLEVGQRVEATRLLAGLTVIEMAELMGVSQSRYTVLQYGRALPDAEKLEPLCDHFGLSLDWLYRGITAMIPLGIHRQLEQHLQSLVDEEGRPHQRKPGRPFGTGGTPRKKAAKDPT